MVRSERDNNLKLVEPLRLLSWEMMHWTLAVIICIMLTTEGILNSTGYEPTIYQHWFSNFMNVSGLGTMNLISLVFLFMCHYYYILFLVIIICNNEINFIITYYYIAASFDSNILSLLPSCRWFGMQAGWLWLQEQQDIPWFYNQSWQIIRIDTNSYKHKTHYTE